jgi:hypothetical protein
MQRVGRACPATTISYRDVRRGAGLPTQCYLESRRMSTPTQAAAELPRALGLLDFTAVVVRCALAAGGTRRALPVKEKQVRQPSVDFRRCLTRTPTVFA